MTKPTIKSARLSALDQLSNVIERRLQNAGPDGLIIHDVAEGLGFAMSTVRGRLGLLEQAGRAYRERHTQPGRTAIYFTWHSTTPVAEAIDTDMPRRTVTRNYPQINRRDWAVAALFGPARKEAA